MTLSSPSKTATAASEFLTCWANVSVDTGSRSMKPRRAVWTSVGAAPTGATGWHRPRRSTSSASPTSGAVDARQGRRSPNHRERPLRLRAEIGARLVQETPAPADRGTAGAPCEGDPMLLRILRSDGEWQTSRLVPLSGRPHLAEVARTQPPPQALCGAKRMIPAPISTTQAPIKSQRSGPTPSTAHSHITDAAT